MVEPMHPFKGGQFYCLLGFPWGAPVDQFSLVQPIDGLSQGVVVTIPLAAHRRLNPRLCQTFGIADGHVLHTPVRVMNQLIGLSWLTIKQGLLQRIEHKVCLHGATDPPAHNPTGIHINHKGHIQPALPSEDVGKV